MYREAVEPALTIMYVYAAIQGIVMAPFEHTIGLQVLSLFN